jgi:hypothetical protein
VKISKGGEHMNRLSLFLCVVLLICVICLSGCFEQPLQVLQNAVNELATQPGKWNTVVQNAINSLGNMTDKVAKDILSEVQTVYNNALGSTGAEFDCQADFIGIRVRQNLEEILAKFKNEPYTPVIIPVVCKPVPDFIKAGETRIIMYYGYDFYKYSQQGQFTVDIEYGNPKSIVRQNIATVAISTNYQLTVDIQTQNFNNLQYPRGPKLVLKWKNSSVEGKSELSIQGAQPAQATPVPNPCAANGSVDYEVTIHTADVDEAGTNANVFITLFGQCGESPETELDIDDYDDFERNATDRYLVTANQDLGIITSVKIRHNNSEDGSGWMLDYINVKNMRTKIW